VSAGTLASSKAGWAGCMQDGRAGCVLFSAVLPLAAG